MKRIIAFLLSLVVFASCFVGCSSKEKQEEAFELVIKNTYDSIYLEYDDSVVRAYNDVCNAIIKGENEVRFNLSMLEKVQQLLYTSFPLVFLTKEITAKDDKSGVSISYKNEFDEHINLVKAFDEKIKAIEDKCGYSSASNSLYTLNVYSYIASNIKISENSGITLYETIMNDEGSVFTYSNMFEYLLLQKGIKAFHIIASDAKGAGWGLSSAQINDCIYYFDVGSEYFANGGKNINYFAMSFEDLQNEGLKDARYTSQGKAYESSDNEFKACRSCKEWSVEGSKLKILQYNLEEVVIDLK